MNRKNIISEKELKYFRIALRTLVIFPKIHKWLYNVPGCPVISNCGTLIEKVSEFLDNHLQPAMKSGKSYVKNTGDFLEKIKSLRRIPEDAFLVSGCCGLVP